MRFVEQEELLRKLQPVKAHFHSNKVTSGTVLAAYLRSRGLEPSGDTWEYASAAFDVGRDFESVADDCQQRFGHQAFGAMTSPNSTVSKELEDEAKNNHAARDGFQKATVQTGPDSNGSNYMDTQDIEASAQFNGDGNHGSQVEVFPSEPSNIENFADLPVLEWFPKVQTEGTIQAEGIRKLLGAREQDDLSILIRETAQNSWDARRKNIQPQFKVVVRALEEAQQQLLRDNVFSGRTSHTVKDPLATVLRKKSIRVVEIHDRGTKGLSGPVRNDVVYEGSDPEDFANLILRIGAPKSDATAGGTYGFGKEAAYGISDNRTVIYWTRTMSEGNPQHRFIGVTLGDPFVIDDLNYTGQQWWGQVVDGERVEPVVGKQAQELGEALFGTTFGDEYGTSIMILEPNVGSATSKNLADKIAGIVKDDLWPKLIRMPDGSVPMPIEVEVDGTPVDVQDESPSSDRQRQVMCLEAIRAVQQGLPNPHELDIRVVELVRKRPQTVLGHLAITVWPRGDENLDRPDSRVSTICLMRHEAELVVKYEVHRGSSNPTMAWTGVFKPVAATDEAFAKAEPPAHDDWKVGQIKDSDFKSIVNVAETRRDETVIQVLEPYERKKQVGGEEVTSQLSKSLGWLAPSVSEVEEPAKREPSARPAGRRSRRALGPELRVDVEDYRLIPSSNSDRTTAQISLVINGDDVTAAALLPTFHALGEDKKEALAPGEVDIRWPVGTPEDKVGRATLPVGKPVVLEIDFYEGLVLDLSFDVEGVE